MNYNQDYKKKKILTKNREYILVLLKSGQVRTRDDVLSSLKQRLEDTSGFGSYIEIKSWLAETHRVSIIHNY
ncbi:MAG: hypothetical protein ACPL7B_12185 [Candidatus Poribacteria bacterium]